MLGAETSPVSHYDFIIWLLGQQENWDTTARGK
jgi:hypothetical protein